MYKSKQEIFDAVWKGFESQNWQYSFFEETCMYRHPNGNKCAIGHLIPDEFYKEDLEGKNVFEPFVGEILFGCNIVKNDDKLVEFLDKLQITHDNCADQSKDNAIFMDEMLEIAKEHNLEIPNTK